MDIQIIFYCGFVFLSLKAQNTGELDPNFGKNGVTTFTPPILSISPSDLWYKQMVKLLPFRKHV